MSTFLKPMAVNGIDNLGVSDGQFILDTATGYFYVDWNGVRYPAGYKGDKGDKGDTGVAGPRGEEGEKGDTGAQGPQGPQGAKGADGVGIVSIVKTGVSGNVDTYTITLSNGSAQTFTVTNGTNGTDGVDGKTHVFTYSNGILTIA